MLAPPEKPDSVPPAAPAAPKRRIITLTHKAPISIIEEDWEVIGQGFAASSHAGSDCPSGCGWDMNIRVRHQDMKRPDQRGHRYSGMYLIHASYVARYDEDEENDIENQVVRVGRVLSWDEAQHNLWDHIMEVGEELRERISHQGRKHHATLIVDRCFASLKPLQADSYLSYDYLTELKKKRP